MNKDKTEVFENYPIPKAVLNLSLPAILSTIVMVVYNIADTYFVGMLADPIQSAAVSLAAPALLAFNAVNNLFGVGASSMMSRCLGKKDIENAKRTASFSFWLSVAAALMISLLYTVFKSPVLGLLGADETTREATREYLFWTVSCGALPAILNVVLSNMVRSEGEAMHAGIGVMSGCFLNIILDPFFVLPKFIGMGAAGAGCATFISNCFATLYLLFFIFRKRKTTIVCLSPAKFGFRKLIIKEVFGVGVPASIQNLLNVTGSIILNNFTAVYGAHAVSAMGIAHKINLFPLYLSMGLTQGIMPLISYNFTSGNRKRMKDAIMFVLKIGLAICLTLAVAVYCFSGQLIRLFMDNDEVVKHGAILLRAMCIGILFQGLDFLAVAVFQSIGKGSYSLIFAVLRKIILEIPAIILFNKLYPLYGMGYSQTFAEFVLGIAAIFMLRKIFRMKYEKPEETGN